MRPVLAVLLLVAATSAAVGQTATTSHAIAAADLAALPQVEATVAYETGHGPEQGRYAGPLLWSVLGADGLIPPGAAKTRLVHSVVVTGRDGYAVAVAFGELDPLFEGKAVLLATSQDAHAIGAGEVRLVVPGDRHGGRAVHDVVRIEVR